MGNAKSTLASTLGVRLYIAMSIATLTYLTIGACLVYVIVQDANVYDYLVLLSKSAGIWLQRQWFRSRYHPDSPWVHWEIDRNAERIAKALMEEFNEGKTSQGERVSFVRDSDSDSPKNL